MGLTVDVLNEDPTGPSVSTGHVVNGQSHGHYRSYLNRWKRRNMLGEMPAAMLSANASVGGSAER